MECARVVPISPQRGEAPGDAGASPTAQQRYRWGERKARRPASPRDLRDAADATREIAASAKSIQPLPLTARLEPDQDIHTQVFVHRAQRRLAGRQRRETVEHPFGTIKARIGATHLLMKTLPRVAAHMALHVLACNLTYRRNESIGEWGRRSSKTVRFNRQVCASEAT
jgi:hypothetical protein